MMKTLVALLILATPALAQDPTPVPRPERRDPLQPPPTPRPPDPPRAPTPVVPNNNAEARQPLPFNPEEVREWLKQNEPETFRNLMQMQNDGRRPEAMRILNEAVPRMRELNDLKIRDPKGYERLMDMRRLERESLEQAEALRRTPPEQREAKMAVLKETLNKLFDAREEVRARELTELKRRVEMLEKAVKERQASKDRIVEKRRRELLGEKSEDDW
jgi:hypothetical protein